MAAIPLVSSDVDGTLITPDKQLTEATLRTARLLSERGIAFTVVSSRPPSGLRMLVRPLSLRLPMGAFSGSAVIGPDLQIVEQHFISEEVARRSADVLSAFAADTWLYTPAGWFVCDPHGHYVSSEKRTIQIEPTVVTDFGPHFARTFKLVGSSQNFTRLAECETAMREVLGNQASVARSQLYYLDITPPGLDKGTFVEALSKRLAVPLRAIAVLGDMENDLAMFRKAGMSIAMGNASKKVKCFASHITTSNAEDGFAWAIKRYVLA
jgi:Cof subfamily protein (haloacid dehalogenase superfamily)